MKIEKGQQFIVTVEGTGYGCDNSTLFSIGKYLSEENLEKAIASGKLIPFEKNSKMIELKKLSEEQFDEKYYESIGCHADEAYEIVEEHELIGIIMISNHNPHYGNKCTFIEWVKIYEPYRGQGKFSPVMENVFKLYNTEEIHFECPDDLLSMYTHMGSISTGISELTGNTMLILRKEDFSSRKK